MHRRRRGHRDRGRAGRLNGWLLAGGNWRNRIAAAAGAALGITLVGLIAALSPAPLALVGPLGASAVLVFAVPASPLAQPWPVVGGNLLSALVGVAVAQAIPNVALAAGLAVGLAILVMTLARCLHPPGGAAALTAVIGGPAVAAQGYGFALWPVGVEALLLTLAGLAWHRASGHAYPHRPAPVSEPRGPDLADVDAAIAGTGESWDIAREDLLDLVRRTNAAAARRR